MAVAGGGGSKKKSEPPMEAPVITLPNPMDSFMQQQEASATPQAGVSAGMGGGEVSGSLGGGLAESTKNNLKIMLQSGAPAGRDLSTYRF